MPLSRRRGASAGAAAVLDGARTLGGPIVRALFLAIACSLAAPATAGAEESVSTGRVEVSTIDLGPVALEFLSLAEVERRGAVVPMRERAVEVLSPTMHFDRTDVVVHYVLSVPILAF